MKHPNEVIMSTGVECAPLLFNKIKIGAAHSSQKDLLIVELTLRHLSINLKQLISLSKKIIIKNDSASKTN